VRALAGPFVNDAVHRLHGYCSKRVAALMRQCLVQHEQPYFGQLVGLGVCARRLLKALADDRNGRNAAFFEFGCVVDTPRRAAASIADRGKHHIATREFRKHSR